jgi:hypothetical protein
MDDRINSMIGKDSSEHTFIAYITLDKRSTDDGFPMSRLQVVEDNSIHPSVQEAFHDMATDIAGSSGYQNLAHLSTPVNQGLRTRVDYNPSFFSVSTKGRSQVPRIPVPRDLNRGREIQAAFFPC